MARRKKGRPISGWLNLDKPADMTSTQAVGKVRWLLKAQKAGYAGTLDPLATGVLPLALGEATKTVPYAQDAAKAYRFTVRWGIATETLDAEGAVMATSDVRPSANAIREALPDFTGEIEQIPPAYSAIKVDGERAYDLARAGQAVELAARTIRIDGLALIEAPDAEHAVIEMRCGKGTYVRALVRDLAACLGTCGHVADLRRLEVGVFSANDAITLADFETMVEAGEGDHALLPVDAPLTGAPAMDVTGEEAAKLRNGQAIALLPRAAQEVRAVMAAQDAEGLEPSRLVIAREHGRTVALGEARAGRLNPIRVFNW